VGCSLADATREVVDDEGITTKEWQEEQSERGNGVQADELTPYEILENSAEERNKARTSVVPNDYTEDTLFRETDDFIEIRDDKLFKEMFHNSIPRFEIISNPEIESFENWKPEPFEKDGRLTKVWERKTPMCVGESGVVYPNFWLFNCEEEVFGYDPIENKELDTQDQLGKTIFIDDKQKLTIRSLDRDEADYDSIAMMDFEGNIHWSLRELNARDPRYIVCGKWLIIGHDNVGYCIYDLENLEFATCLSCTNDDSINYFNYVQVFNDKYFWSLWTDILAYDRILYRINPETLEVLRYDIERPQRVSLVDGKLMIISNDSKSIYITDPETGVLENELKLEDHISGAEFTAISPSDHPFVCEVAEKEKYIFNPFNPGNSFKVDYHIDTSYYNEGMWYGWHNYYGYDGKSIYGINTYSGKRTWEIPMSEFPEAADSEYFDIDVVAIDECGVMVEGHTLYRHFK